MNSNNIFIQLQENGLEQTTLNYRLYKEFSNTESSTPKIVKKIKEYHEYNDYANSKYPDDIMEILRQRAGLNKFDFSKDSELNKLSSNEVFKHVLKFNGLSGDYTNIIKRIVEEVYGVDLNSKNL